MYEIQHGSPGDWPDEVEEQQHTSYYGRGQGAPHFQQIPTTKIPPGYDGTTSWFSFEEQVEDWTDVTELDGEKRGPALKNRLEGTAATYKTLLDRDRLKESTTADPNAGVRYLLNFLRPHFVKGGQSVFLWRLFAFFKAHRGHQDLQQWLGRMTVLKKRMMDAWGDLYESVGNTDPAYQQWIRQQATATQGTAQAIDLNDSSHIAAGLEEYNKRQRNGVHMATYPLSDNLFSLIVTVFADMNSDQRERFQSTMVLKGQRVNNYTFDLVRETLIELFVMAKTTLDNPNLRTVGNARSFFIIEDGDMWNESGHWVEDDETGELGFLPESQDIFWVFDDANEAWQSRHFQGRSLRRFGRKGKGKGKGKKGRSRGGFRPRKKGKGRGHYSHQAEAWSDTTWDDQAWDASPAYKATGAWDPTTGLWIDYAYQDPTAWQTSDWQDDATSWGDTAWFGKDGKGKGKGKKGKGKKGKGKKGNFQGEGKDGKGKGDSSAANVAMETPPTNGAADDVWGNVPELWDSAWLSYEEWPTMEKQDTPDNYEEWQARVHLHRTGVVQEDDIIHNAPLAGGPDILLQNTCIATVPGNDVYKRTHHCFWDVFKALPETPKLPLPQMPVKGKLVDMRNSPTHAILDLGCTRAVGSRPAITAFMAAATKRGLVCEVLPTQGKFNFANSQTATCTEI